MKTVANSTKLFTAVTNTAVQLRLAIATLVQYFRVRLGIHLISRVFSGRITNIEQGWRLEKRTSLLIAVIITVVKRFTVQALGDKSK